MPDKPKWKQLQTSKYAEFNTGTTIVTLLMVFLIQNTQNRDAKSIHLKLNEIIRAVKGARNELVCLEELSDEDLKKLEQQFARIRKKAERDEKQGARWSKRGLNGSSRRLRTISFNC